MNNFLASSAIINFDHPDVAALARELSGANRIATARRCYIWVRDEVRHSVDHNQSIVTCSASEVLAERSGFCYAKSHLLAALLRANRIQTGLCYQRLHQGDGRYCLHGLNAVMLPDFGWYRIDPRGNKPGIDTAFTPPQERLAYPIERPGEYNLTEIYAEPLPLVLAALQRHATVDELNRHLPDLPPA
jgi:transglutaminase-like putative cysteine protease